MKKLGLIIIVPAVALIWGIDILIKAEWSKNALIKLTKIGKKLDSYEEGKI